MVIPRRGPFRRRADGTIAVRLSAQERELLRELPRQLRDLLTSGDPSLRRLFPVAYNRDPEHDAEFQRLMRDELLERKMATAQRLADDAGALTLRDDAQVLSWLGATNDLRLVLGTQLDVSDDVNGNEALESLGPDEPRAYAYAIYSWLGMLQEMLLRATESADESSEREFFDQLFEGLEEDDPASPSDPESGSESESDPGSGFEFGDDERDVDEGDDDDSPDGPDPKSD